MAEFARETKSVPIFVDLEDTVSKGAREDWTDDVSGAGSWRNSAQGDGARWCPTENVEAVARDLDSKIETLLRECA
jgi:hypothetical protein